jgi:hypothetical protein
MVATGQTTAKMTPRLPHGTQVVKGAANPGGLNAPFNHHALRSRPDFGSATIH